MLFSAAGASAATTFFVRGGGYGHGIGMSQYGAYGYAQHGKSYSWILGHYYQGTQLAQIGAGRVVRVLVASGPAALSGATRAGSKTLSASATYTVTANADGTVRLADAAGKKVLVSGAPLTVTGQGPLQVAGAGTYRGSLEFRPDGAGGIETVEAVGLDDYVRGVISAEVPSGWPAEALKAQAVAARSYALANVTTGRAFDLYGDTRSQVFGGVTAENAATSAAVDATKGQVVLYKGKVANTLFFSTSGGRTASAFESTGLNVPYLVPVADPYDTASPYHDWGPMLLDAAVVAKQFKLASPIADLQTTTGPSGRVQSVTIVSEDDSQVTMTANQVRGALELRSTWFTPALLQLLPKSKTMTYGGALSLTGHARGVDTVSLEAKPFGLDWAPVGDLLLDADGAFATVVRPQIGTQYRLVWGEVRAGLAKIAVAVRVDATVQQGAATGTTTPVVQYAPTELQWSADGATGWQTVATSTTDDTGAFSISAPTPETAGAYRVRVAPGHGLAPGLSKTACC